MTPSTTTTQDLVQEAADLTADVQVLLPIAHEIQWVRSPRPSYDAKDRKVSGRVSDPTADAALDDGRLRVRRCLRRSEADLEDAVIALRGVRLALERALAIVAEERAA